jgi:hypothetical protein
MLNKIFCFGKYSINSRLFEFRSSYASDFMTDVSTNTEPKKNRYNNVIFKALSAVNTNITAFWNVTS